MRPIVCNYILVKASFNIDVKVNLQYILQQLKFVVNLLIYINS